MLSINVDVGSFDCALEMRPMALNRVRVVDADNVFFFGMLHDAMLIGEAKVLVGRVAVRGDDGFWRDVF
jgi:hypothetical protein